MSSPTNPLPWMPRPGCTSPCIPSRNTTLNPMRSHEFGQIESVLMSRRSTLPSDAENCFSTPTSARYTWSLMANGARLRLEPTKNEKRDDERTSPKLDGTRKWVGMTRRKKSTRHASKSLASLPTRYQTQSNNNLVETDKLCASFLPMRQMPSLSSFVWMA